MYIIEKPTEFRNNIVNRFEVILTKNNSYLCIIGKDDKVKDFSIKQLKNLDK